jgi:hypothetical protein
MAALMASPTSVALTDLDPESGDDRPHRRQIDRVLVADIISADVPATVALIGDRGVVLHVEGVRDRPVTVTSVGIAGLAARLLRFLLRGLLRERCRLPFPGPASLLELGLQLDDQLFRFLELGQHLVQGRFQRSDPNPGGAPTLHTPSIHRLARIVVDPHSPRETR